MFTKIIFGVFIFAFAVQFISAQNQKDYYAHLKSEHKKVLQQWLEKSAGMRPAVVEDASQLELKAWREHDKNFFPYYVAGDFNKDGKEDFAVILKVINTKDQGALVVFNAPFINSTPAYFKRGFGVRLYYLEYMKDEKMLYFTEYETHGFFLKPKGGKYVEYEPD
jgi:hypothetical protein